MWGKFFFLERKSCFQFSRQFSFYKSVSAVHPVSWCNSLSQTASEVRAHQQMACGKSVSRSCRFSLISALCTCIFIPSPPSNWTCLPVADSNQVFVLFFVSSYCNILFCSKTLFIFQWLGAVVISGSSLSQLLWELKGLFNLKHKKCSFMSSHLMHDDR